MIDPVLTNNPIQRYVITAILRCMGSFLGNLKAR